MVDIRPLATGRADVSAYELTGAGLAALRREAGRLCPQGAEILRQAGRDQTAENIDGRMRRWLNVGSEWIDPPSRAAQLVVLCHVSPDGHRIAAASVVSAGVATPDSAAKPAAAATDEPAPSLPIVPIGPVSVEW